MFSRTSLNQFGTQVKAKVEHATEAVTKKLFGEKAAHQVMGKMAKLGVRGWLAGVVMVTLAAGSVAAMVAVATPQDTRQQADGKCDKNFHLSKKLGRCVPDEKNTNGCVKSEDCKGGGTHCNTDTGKCVSNSAPDPTATRKPEGPTPTIPKYLGQACNDDSQCPAGSRCIDPGSGGHVHVCLLPVTPTAVKAPTPTKIYGPFQPTPTKIYGPFQPTPTALPRGISCVQDKVPCTTIEQLPGTCTAYSGGYYCKENPTPVPTVPLYGGGCFNFYGTNRSCGRDGTGTCVINNFGTGTCQGPQGPVKPTPTQIPTPTKSPYGGGCFNFTGTNHSCGIDGRGTCVQNAFGTGTCQAPLTGPVKPSPTQIPTPTKSTYGGGCFNFTGSNRGCGTDGKGTCVQNAFGGGTCQAPAQPTITKVPTPVPTTYIVGGSCSPESSKCPDKNTGVGTCINGHCLIPVVPTIALPTPTKVPAPTPLPRGACYNDPRDEGKSCLTIELLPGTCTKFSGGYYCKENPTPVPTVPLYGGGCFNFYGTNRSCGRDGTGTCVINNFGTGTCQSPQGPVKPTLTKAPTPTGIADGCYYDHQGCGTNGRGHCHTDGIGHPWECWDADSPSLVPLKPTKVPTPAPPVYGGGCFNFTGSNRGCGTDGKGTCVRGTLNSNVGVCQAPVEALKQGAPVTPAPETLSFQQAPVQVTVKAFSEFIGGIWNWFLGKK